MPGTRGETETSPVVSFYSIVLLVVFLDQFTKFLALAFLSHAETVPVISGIFHLTLVHNSGIAFGFFRQHESILFFLITASLGVLIFLGQRICQSQSSATSRLGLALILGGAIGNWIDRIRFEAVIDFLDFRIWPVFNMADSAITIGVFLYLLLFFERSKKKGTGTKCN